MHFSVRKGHAKKLGTIILSSLLMHTVLSVDFAWSNHIHIFIRIKTEQTDVDCLICIQLTKVTKQATQVQHLTMTNSYRKSMRLSRFECSWNKLNVNDQAE